MKKERPWPITVGIIPERFTTVNPEGFHGTYGLKSVYWKSCDFITASHWFKGWKKIFIGPRVGVGGPDSVRSFRFFRTIFVCPDSA